MIVWIRQERAKNDSVEQVLTQQERKILDFARRLSRLETEVELAERAAERRRRERGH